MPDNRARVWFALFVLVIFCMGGAIGFFLGRHVPPPGGPGGPFPPGLDAGGPGFGEGMGHRGGPPPFGRGRGGLPALHPELVARLTSELQLDAAQQDQVKKILDEHRDHLEQLHHDARDRFEKEQAELQTAIRAVLHSDQIERFNTFIARRPPERK